MLIPLKGKVNISTYFKPSYEAGIVAFDVNNLLTEFCLAKAFFPSFFFPGSVSGFITHRG